MAQDQAFRHPRLASVGTSGGLRRDHIPEPGSLQESSDGEGRRVGQRPPPVTRSWNRCMDLIAQDPSEAGHRD